MANLAFINERMLSGFGVDLVVHHVASELCRRGHDVTVYASVTDLSPEDTPYCLRTLPTRATRLFPLYDRHATVWAEVVDGAAHDAILIESFPFFSLIPHLHTPTIAVDHGISDTSGLDAFSRLNFEYVRLTQQRRFLPAADALIVISKFVRDLLPPSLRSSARVIYNGVDHYAEPDSTSVAAIRDRLGAGDETVLAVYVGRLNPEAQPYKGTADLMSMAGQWKRDAPQIMLAMAGRGDETDAARIAAAGAVPLLDVPEIDLRALLAAADIYVTASTWEGFDLPIMEAARFGVPSVALARGAHPEIVRAGETGVLTSGTPELSRAVVDLAADANRRRALGDEARKHAEGFTWASATDAYEEVITSVARPRPKVPASSSEQRGGETMERPRSDVTAVILNYGSPFDVLDRLVTSLVNQSHPVEILIVDNNAPKNADVLEAIEHKHRTVEALRLGKNTGFATGMNRGVEHASTEYVLLLNNDTVLDDGAVAEMRRVIDLDERCVGIAPKIVFESAPHVLDSVGNLITSAGSAYNMGIGQYDIGQYDRVEYTFGPCFAAALLKRHAWDPVEVGPLDDSYFMYYEDVDWNMRAGLYGWKFLTAPQAIVYHAHSLSTREQSYDFKYHLIQRNYVRTIVKNFPTRAAIHVLIMRVLAMLGRALLGPYRKAAFRALWETIVGLPTYLEKRRIVQGRRRVPHKGLFDHSHGEEPFFDPVGYEPEITLEALAATYRRLYLLSHVPDHRRIADEAAWLAQSRLRFDHEFVQEALRPLVAEQPPVIKEFVEQL